MYLLDTNVVSEIRKRRRDPAVGAWFADVDPGELFLSSLVIGELAFGIALLERRGDVKQASQYARWLAELKETFGARILGVSTSIAERWGRLIAARPLPFVDGLLAATALEHDLTLVTRDAAVAGTGVRLLDPWAQRLDVK
jgi:toxin FitB